MPYIIGSGNKATITLATSGAVGRFKQIGGVDLELGEQDVSGLDSDEFEEFEPNDLAKLSDTELEIFFNTKMSIIPTGASPTAPFLRLGKKELITFTYPTRSDETTPAAFVAWGFFKKLSLPVLVNNTTLMIKASIKWANRNNAGLAVKPVWTKAVVTP